MAEWVGGAFLSAFLQVLFDRLASRQIIDFIKGQKLEESLLHKLKTTFISVNGVLEDAEEKQITNSLVQGWLDELKDAVYEADDLLDKIAYKAIRSGSETGSRSRRYKGKVRDFVSSHIPFKGINDKLKEILERLEYLAKQKGTLSLIEGNIGKKPSSYKLPSTSLLDKSGVCGRDDDKEAIIKLLWDDVNGNDGLGVVAIVGMGGIGKTALAQLVYNDIRVQERFNVRIWVCVSEEFDVVRVTKDILKELGFRNCENMTLNQLQLELEKILKGEKYLLVLDDFWNENYAHWNDFQKPLKSGAHGSKIVVTTRGVNVASAMGTVLVHPLNKLSDDDCWHLFAKHAFDDGISSRDPNLEAIGREMVRKCDGLPLAAKTLGGLLRSQSGTDKWKKILKSNIWTSPNNDILPALRLSYHYLPSHLKRCFAYCAIFPKDYEFEKEELVLLWMAEGFLVQSNESEGMEEVGNEYFNDLVSRSFFQRSSGYRSCYVMHDLISDLAGYVAGEFCSKLEADSPCTITCKTRHLLYAMSKHDSSEKVDSIYKAKLLRTFLFVEGSHINDEMMHNFLTRLRRIRVLSLSDYSNLVKLPESIAKMKHLRYLNLSKTLIQKLPDFVCMLYSLQTLILSQCSNLVELPINMGWLLNLCHLDIRGTKLQQMPAQMGQLKNLQILTNFVVGEQSGSSIGELGQLQHLQGKLSISNLQNVADAHECCVANLKAKEHLEELELIWNGDTDNSSHEVILEQLQPHTNMKCLSVFGYGGATFPEWVGHSSFSNVVSVQLDGCKHCLFLPPLGQLVSLKDFSIVDFGEVLFVGPQFFGGCMSTLKPFRFLKILKFEKMPRWREWHCNVDHGKDGAFPLLQELYIKDCPNLIKALPDDLPSLTTLEIEGCPKLEASLPRSPTILRMMLKDDSRAVLLVKSSSGLYNLLVDRFHFLDSLVEAVEQMGARSITFQEIEVRNCDSLKCFPLKLFSKLKTLRISRCPNLESLFSPEATHEDFASLSSLEIRECSNLAPFPEGELPTPNLKKLLLLGCSNVQSFPGMTLLPSTLISLKIFDFQNLRSLDFEGLQHLTSLRELEICNCLQLKSMPKEGLPSSLSSLSISLCPLLEKKCAQGGEDWPRIAHIRHIKIGARRIN